MTEMRVLITYKCEKGHLMDRSFPPGTQVGDEDETTCATCLHVGEVKKAFAVFVKVEEDPHGKRTA